MPEHPGYFTVAEVVKIYRVRAARVYLLASRHHWRRYKTGRTVHYHRHDVDHALTKENP